MRRVPARFLTGKNTRGREMEEKGTKVKIDSKAAYVRDFNGQIAVATDKRGLESLRQGFELMAGGLIFLDPSDYTVQA